MESVGVLGYLEPILKNQEATNLQQSQQMILTALQSIQTKEVREMLTYCIDAFQIKKFGDDWLPFLLERHIYNTRIGGELFFNRLEQYISSSNIEMVQSYLFMWKMGFAFSDGHKLLYDQGLKMLPVIYAPYNVVNYVKPNFVKKSISIIWFLLPLGLLWLIINLYELTQFYNVRYDINEVLELINEVHE